MESEAGPILQPARRFEWERILRRCQISGRTKLVAFVLAQFGNADGTRVRPGVNRLMTSTGLPERTIERCLSDLRDLGLIERLANGGGRNARAAEYRLTIPEDLLERVELGSPDEQGKPRNSRRKGGGSSPVDKPGTPAVQVAAVEAPDGPELPPIQNELPPIRSELPPKQAPTPANDPHVTCDDARHQKTKEVHHPLDQGVGHLPVSTRQRAPNDAEDPRCPGCGWGLWEDRHEAHCTAVPKPRLRGVS